MRSDFPTLDSEMKRDILLHEAIAGWPVHFASPLMLCEPEEVRVRTIGAVVAQFRPSKRTLVLDTKSEPMLMNCDGIVPVDASKLFEQKQMGLMRQTLQLQLDREIPLCFGELKTRTNRRSLHQTMRRNGAKPGSWKTLWLPGPETGLPRR